MSQDTLSSTSPKLVPQFIEPAAAYGDLKREQAERARETAPSAFKVRAQLLEQGRSDSVLAATPNLTLRLKVYASGGENELHAHANEDHIFVILQGTAEFFDDDGLLAALGPNEGVTLPKGQRYRFHATSVEPLVLLRIGSPNESAQGLDGRIDAEGAQMPGDSVKNKAKPRIPKTGVYFG